jgi:hypothetical protein
VRTVMAIWDADASVAGRVGCCRSWRTLFRCGIELLMR